jgi:hypothetical protein
VLRANQRSKDDQPIRTPPSQHWTHQAEPANRCRSRHQSIRGSVQRVRQVNCTRPITGKSSGRGPGFSRTFRRYKRIGVSRIQRYRIPTERAWKSDLAGNSTNDPSVSRIKVFNPIWSKNAKQSGRDERHCGLWEQIISWAWASKLNRAGVKMKELIVTFLAALCVTSLVNGLNIDISHAPPQQTPAQLSGSTQLENETNAGNRAVE